MRLAPLFAAALGGLGTLLPADARASERDLASAVEPAVAAPGGWELEPRSTLRHDRAYGALDERLELEHGLARSLRGSLDPNLAAPPASPRGVKPDGFSLALELGDAVTDALCATLGLEFTPRSDEIEIEARLVADKRFGALRAALALAGELAWATTGEDPGKRDGAAEVAAAFGVHLGGPLFLAAEVRGASHFDEGGGLTWSALFAGPILSCAGLGWWASLAVQPQLAAFQGAADAGSDLERLELRLRLGFDL